MIIGLGSDHGGYELKENIKKYLLSSSYEVVDYGCRGLESCDYPLYARDLCHDVVGGKINFGILICTTGIGMSISANRYPYVRAALVSNEDMCILTRKHNNSNVLCLGAKYVSVDEAIKYVKAFINTDFEGGRHQRRITMIERNE